MRVPVSLLTVPALFLSSCAYQGVIAQKESRPHPLYNSIGVEGMYDFVLRDQAGGLHRQMVTPQVFEQYAEGQYFNDLQPAAQPTDNKTMQASARPISHAVASRSAIARVKTRKSTRVAAKSAHSSVAHKSTKTRAVVAKNSSKRTVHHAQVSTHKSSANHSTVAHNARASRRRLAKGNAKPWKETPPTVEAAVVRPEPAPPGEAPPPIDKAKKPAAAKSGDEADIVYLPPTP